MTRPTLVWDVHPALWESDARAVNTMERRRCRSATVIFSKPSLAKAARGRYNCERDASWQTASPSPTSGTTPTPPTSHTPARATAAASQARVKRPERKQIEWRPLALDQLIPADHRVRVVWRYVESLNLEPLYAQIKAVEGGVGRDATDPRI